jgi:hypothetical protein
VLSIPVSSHFPWKSIWNVKASSRGVFCVDEGFREDLNFG